MRGNRMAITAWLCAIGTATFAMTTLASVVFAQVALASTAPTNIPDTIDAAPADTTRRMDSLQVHVSEPLPLTGRFRGATRAYCSSFMITECKPVGWAARCRGLVVDR
jgi:hypothetical protein